MQISAPTSFGRTSVGSYRCPTERFASNDEKVEVNDKEGDNKWLSNGRGLATAAAIVVAVSVAAAPASFAYTLLSDSLSTVSGGASSLATTTSVLMERLSETGFYQAFSLVFLSEIGDKTFFIAGLLAMKTSRLVSFIGSIGALAVMTVISVLIGQIFHQVPSGIAQGIPLDDVAAVAAFTFFGIKTLKDAFDMDEGSSIMDEELAEAEAEVEGSDTIKQSTAW